MEWMEIPTPSYVIDEKLLLKNLEILAEVKRRTGCHILLAQKCFSMFSVYPLLGQYLDGTTASGLFEAKLGHDYMGGETHVYSAAYREEEMEEIFSICDHVVFNSFSQWTRYREKALQAGVECGLRINPECSTQKGHDIYDPCAPFSRLGIPKKEFLGQDLAGITGLHFHTLCEQNSDDLKTTLDAVEEQFGEFLPHMKWLNFGGGHHITREDYDLETLISCILHMQETYGVKVYLEPGEAVALNAGFLVSQVLDLVENGMQLAILDTSAACHMPDVLEMPYRPEVIGAGRPKEKPFTYRFGGPTCLAGDCIGEYSFEKPLHIGDRVEFCDMAIYSMVKTNTFNGMKLPSIVLKQGQEYHLIKSFGYEEFKNRLS